MPGGQTCSSTAPARATPTTSTSTGTRPTPTSKTRSSCPILGDQYGKTLEARLLRLSYDDGGFVIHYYDTTLPVAPRTYLRILSPQVEELTRRLGDEHDQLLEYRSILTALKHLPPRTGLQEERQAERYREVAIIKRRLAALVEASPEVRSAISAAVDRFNGRIGNSESFDELDAPDRRAVVPAGILARCDGRDQLPPLLRRQRAGRHPHRRPARLRRHTRRDLPHPRRCPSLWPPDRSSRRALQPRALLPEPSRTLSARPAPGTARGCALDLPRSRRKALSALSAHLAAGQARPPLRGRRENPRRRRALAP